MSRSDPRPCRFGNVAQRAKSGLCLCDRCKERRRARDADKWRKKAHDPAWRELHYERAKRSIEKRMQDPSYKAMRYEQKKSIYRRNPLVSMLSNAKNRAREAGVPFDLCREDVLIPSVCPVLGIPIQIGDGKLTANSPSLDRLLPSRGYVRGNVVVISHKANRIKGAATPREIISLAAWLTKVCSKDLL